MPDAELSRLRVLTHLFHDNPVRCGRDTEQRQVEQFAYSCTPSKWQNWDSKPGVRLWNSFNHDWAAIIGSVSFHFTNTAGSTKCTPWIKLLIISLPPPLWQAAQTKYTTLLEPALGPLGTGFWWKCWAWTLPLLTTFLDLFSNHLMSPLLKAKVFYFFELPQSWKEAGCKGNKP